MINYRRPVSLLSLLLAAVLGVAACSVSEDGNIPCADDSSCPSDYPSCVSGKCIAPTTPFDGNQIKIVSVAGQAPSATGAFANVVHGNVRVQVVSRSPSGVSKVALTVGTTNVPQATDASVVPPLYAFDVDTTTITDTTATGGVAATLTATLTAGDATTKTATGTITVDNKPPTVTGPAGAALAMSTQNALVGTQVTVDLVTSETATVSGTVQLEAAGSPLLPMSLIDSGTAGVERLSFSVSQLTTPGTYDVVITAKDLAGNTASFPAAGTTLTFSVGVAITATMSLVTHPDGQGGNILLNGIAAATDGDAVKATLSVLPAGIGIASGFPQYTIVNPHGTATQLTASQDGSGEFDVSGVSAAIPGIYTFNAVVQSVNGAIANASSQFIVSRVPPKVVGDTNGIAISPAFAGPNQTTLTIQFSTDSAPATKSVTVNGNAATLSQSVGNSFAFSYTTTSTDLPTTPGVATIPVVVVIKDQLGNQSNYSTNATVDNLSPVVQTAVSVPGASAVISANNIQQLSFTLRDVGGKVGANPTVTVLPNAAGSNPAVFVSRTDTGDSSAFVYQYKVNVSDAEGPASVKIVATDAALNPLTSTQAAVFTIDSTPPALSALGIDHPVQSNKTGGAVTVSVTVRDCNITTAPTIAFVDNRNGAVVESGTMTGTGTPGCSTGVTYNFSHSLLASELTGDQVTATITAIDRAGNGATQSVSYTVDDAAPSLLAASAFTPATNNTGSTSFTLVASKPLSSATVLKVQTGANTPLGDGDSNGGTTVHITPPTYPCTSCVYTITGLAPSSNTAVTWKAVVSMVDTVPTPNTASATSVATYVVDKVLPALSGSATDLPGVVRIGQQVSISGTATKALSGVTVTTSSSSNHVDASAQACSFNASNGFTCLVTVTDGLASDKDNTTATVTLTDSVGNVSGALPAGTYIVDNQNPAMSGVSVGTGVSAPIAAYGFFKAGATVSLQVSVQDCNFQKVTAAVSYISKVNSQPASGAMTAGAAGVATCNSSGTFIFTRAVAADEPDGVTSISIQANDLAGNVAVTSAQYTVDNTLPTLLATSFFNPTTSFTGNATFTLNASEPLASVTAVLVQTPNAGTAGTITPASTLPCNPCVFNLANLKRSAVDTWNVKVTAATDVAGNSVSGLPTQLAATLTVDGLSTAFTYTPVKTSATFVRSTVASPATIVVTGTTNRALSAIALDTIKLANNSPSGDTSVCSFTNPNNQGAVTCVITVSSTEGARALLTGTMTDVNSNSGVFSATTYTVDNTAPTITGVALSGGVAVGTTRYYSAKVGFSTVTLTASVQDCDGATAVSVVATDAGGHAQTFSVSGSPGTPSCGSAANFVFTHSVSSDTDGITNVTVTSTDSTGNKSSSSVNYVVDRTNPTISGVTFNSGPDNTGTVSASAIINNTGSFSATATFSEPVGINLTGSNPVQTIAFVDASNNVYQNGVTTNGITPTVVLSANTPGPCSVCTFNVTGLELAAGSSLTVTSKFNYTDIAGNNVQTAFASVPTYTADRVLPDLSSIAITPSVAGKNSNSGKVTISGTASKPLAGASVAISNASGDVGTCSLDPATQQNVICVITINDVRAASNSKTATLTLTDLAGNNNSTTPTNHFQIGYTVDNLALSVGNPVASPSVIAQGQTATLTGTVTKPAGAPVTLASATYSYTAHTGGSSSGNCSVSGATYSCLVTSTNTTSNGTDNDSVSINVQDIAGNVGSSSGNQLAIDNRNAIAFALTVTPTSTVSLAGTQVQFSWVGNSADNCTAANACAITSSDHLFTSQVTSNSTVSSGGPTTTPAKTTTYTLTVRAVNGTSATSTATVTVAPTIGNFQACDANGTNCVATKSVTTTGSANASFTATISGVACSGASSGNGSCVISGTDASTKALTCSLAGNSCTITTSASPTTVPLGGVDYTLAVTDLNGAVATSLLTIKDYAAPTASSFLISAATLGTATSSSAVPTNSLNVTGATGTVKPTFSFSVASAGGCATPGNCSVTCFTTTGNCNSGTAAISTDSGTVQWSSLVTPPVIFTINAKNPAGASLSSPPTVGVNGVAAPTASSFQISSIAGATSSTTLPSAGPVFATGSSLTPTFKATVSAGGNCVGTFPANPCSLTCSDSAGGSCGGVTSAPVLEATIGSTGLAWPAAVSGAVSFSLNIVSASGAPPASPPSAIPLTTVAAPTTSSFLIASQSGATTATTTPSAAVSFTGGTPTPTFSWAVSSSGGCATPTNCTITCTGACGAASSLAVSSDSSAGTAWPNAITGTATFTLNVKNPATAAESTNSASMTAVAAPSATGFSGPTLIVAGSPVSFTLPASYTSTSTAFIQVAGANVTPDIHAASSPYSLGATPTATTTYSLVAFNSIGASATIGSVTVRVVSSASEDVLPSALFGATSTLITGAGTHAGKVLITGGATTAYTYAAATVTPAGSQAAYYFDPTTGLLTLISATALPSARAFHTATALTGANAGKIILAGGNSSKTGAYLLYDDSTGNFTSLVDAGSSGFCNHAAVALDANSVGIFGGTDCTATNAGTTYSAVVRVAGTLAELGGSHNIGTGRAAASAVLIGATGIVLVAGGYTTAGTALTSSDMMTYTAGGSGGFNQANGKVMNFARLGATATAYGANAATCDGAGNGDCTILIAGGNGSATHTAEIFTFHQDANHAAFANSANEMQQQRQFHAATLLNSAGLILFSGGLGASAAVKSTEIFDPGTGLFTTGAPMAFARQEFSAPLTAIASPLTVVYAGGATSGVTELGTVSP